jgi:hypothetical protein
VLDVDSWLFSNNYSPYLLCLAILTQYAAVLRQSLENNATAKNNQPQNALYSMSKQESPASAPIELDSKLVAK